MEVWTLLFQAGLLPLLRNPNFLSKNRHFFNQLIFNDLTCKIDSFLIWLMFKIEFRPKPKKKILEFEKYSNGQNWEIKLILYFIFYWLIYCIIIVYDVFDYRSFYLIYGFGVTFLFPFSSSYLLKAVLKRQLFPSLESPKANY